MITRIIDRCLLRQLVFASVVATVIFSGPVILISVSMQLPSAAVLSKLIWPALSTIAPMIVYHTVPLLVPLAAVWCYANFSSDGTLLTMQMAGLSNLSVRAPAITVASVAMLLAYAMSCWVAPRTAGNLQDLMMSLHHDLNPDLLRAGHFNSIDHGRQVVFFRSRLSDTAVADVFIRDRTDTGEERVYQAQKAVFARNQDEGKAIVLLDGTAQLFNGENALLRATAFDRLVLPLTEFVYGRSTHPYTLVEEMGLLAFLSGRADAFNNPIEGRNWTREAVKRFGIPVLALIHMLLGLELLAAWGTMSGRDSDPVALVCAILGLSHLALVVMAEQTSVALPWAGAFAAVALAELALAIALMTIRSRRVAPVPEMASVHISAARAALFGSSSVPVMPLHVDVALRPAADRRSPLASLAAADAIVPQAAKKIA